MAYKITKNDNATLKNLPGLWRYMVASNNWFAKKTKRLFDVLVSLWGMLILTPLFLFLLIAIKRDSPGPIFYRGPRMGRGGKVFNILKFRTMSENPQSYTGPFITAEGDARITQIGKWLRDTKLNELPQLWNVLVGEMSMVGPRPEVPDLAATWPKNVKKIILSVRPGITSPASILYRDEEKMLKGKSLMDHYLDHVLPDKLRLDQLYVRSQTFMGDLDVLFLTAIALFPNLKRVELPESLLFRGPFSIIANRYVSWFVIDSVTAFLAIGLTGIFWRMSAPLDVGVPIALLLAAGFALTFSLVNTILGLGRISWRQARPSLALDLMLSNALATAMLFLVNYFLDTLLPPGMVFNAALLAYLGFVAARYRERLLTGAATRWLHYRGNQTSYGERVLVVGAGECGQLATWLMQKSNLLGAYTIFGMVDDDVSKQGLIIEGHRVLGQTQDIPKIVKKHDIGLILYAISQISKEDQEKILVHCRKSSARLVIIPDLLNIFRKHITEFDDGEANHELH